MLVGLALLWGSSYPLIKYALESFSPAEIVFLRGLLGTAVLLVFVRGAGGQAWAAVRAIAGRPGRAMVFGAVAIALPFLLISFGELEVPAGLTAILVAPAPIFAIILGRAFEPETPVVPAQVAGVALGFAGVALVVGVESISTVGEFLGGIAMVGAAACYATSGFVVRRWYPGVPSPATSLAAVAVTTVLTLPAGLATAGGEAPTAAALAAIVLLGAGGTALAFVIMFRLYAEVGPQKATLVGYLIPPVSLAWGVIALDEEITAAPVAGLVLILAGVALAASRRAPPPGAEEALALDAAREPTS
jgi:drug/metabolite transporter (DMT)-like permease